MLLSSIGGIPRACGVTEASTLKAARFLLASMLAMLIALCLAPTVVQAQQRENDISVELLADGPPQPGREWMLALHFVPKSPEWHGYWANPGDAGLGMELDWKLPQGWTAAAPLYPVPHRLLIGGLMNHVYEGPHTVLVSVAVPEDAAVANPVPISVAVDYLACTDRICVPQRAELTLDPSQARADPRFAQWRAAIAPMLDSTGLFEIAGDRLRIGVPLPAGVELGDVHLFLEQREPGEGLQADYAGVQTFIREGDLLVAELPLKQIAYSGGETPDTLTGILSFDDRAGQEARGVRFVAKPGDVPLEGVSPLKGARNAPDIPLGLLLVGALVGGLLLNVMPCVFPILSLKALSLAKAGGDEHAARRDALAYTLGAVLACAALGALLLLLRSAGEQVGWAFQLQEPSVVVALFLLAVAITANFYGTYEISGLAISGGKPTSRGSFATGLLAAFVATPCTGPFMAAALGAALLLPPLQALLLFVALGLGLALPFLLVGFVPALRRMLPKPGAWMATFRKAMAFPMGLTALALLWLLMRLGGKPFAFVALLVAFGMVIGLAVTGRLQRLGKMAWPAFGLIVAPFLIFGAFALPASFESETQAEEASLLEPIAFSEAALAQARASGKPVFVWFTADWCVTCKVNEGVAIEREATRAAFDSAGVIALRGDFTRRDPEIADFLARHGAAGVPLYLWYEPGADAQQLPQVLTPDLLTDLAGR